MGVHAYDATGGWGGHTGQFAASPPSQRTKTQSEPRWIPAGKWSIRPTTYCETIEASYELIVPLSETSAAIRCRLVRESSPTAYFAIAAASRPLIEPAALPSARGALTL